MIGSWLILLCQWLAQEWVYDPKLPNWQNLRSLLGDFWGKSSSLLKKSYKKIFFSSLRDFCVMRFSGNAVAILPSAEWWQQNKPREVESQILDIISGAPEPTNPEIHLPLNFLVCEIISFLIVEDRFKLWFLLSAAQSTLITTVMERCENCKGFY